MRENEIRYSTKSSIFLRQFTRVSSHDESNCSNGGESECPPTTDKSTIECPQIEALCLWLVYLRLRLPECHPNWRVLRRDLERNKEALLYNN